MMREAPRAMAWPAAGRPAQPAPLPAWPDAWYVVARSADLGGGRILDGEIADRAYVLYRAGSGPAVALDAHCPHMGTHLRTGQVSGDGLRCALHHWTIGSDGVLQGNAPCERYRSRSWPVAERFGLVFLYAGTGQPPAPPFADAGDGFVWTTARPLVLAADWRAMLVNGFDTEHMRSVHQRAVVRPPEIARTAAGALRMSYETCVTAGGGSSSWLTARLSGGRLRIAQTCFGPTMLVESRLGRFESRAVFGLVSRGGKTYAYSAFGAPRSGVAARLRLALTRTLYVAFLRKDYAVVEGMRLIVDGVSDPGVRGISEYLRSLPELGAAGRAG